MEYLKSGKMVEDIFSKFLKEPKTATKEQDMKEHWDLSDEIKFDVKGMKKISRSDEQPNENYHWIEIKNVNNDVGWAYGESDFFAFETHDYFIIVEAERLRSLIAAKVVKEFPDKPEPYRLYSRNNRKDIITLAKTIDLMFIASSIIEKKM